MKKITIVALVALTTSCGWLGRKKQAAVAVGEATGQYAVEGARQYTVEDTVRLELGGKLYYIEDYDVAIAPEDSITVIAARYFHQPGEELYREYRFIVHRLKTRSHSFFESAALDAEYEDWARYDSGERLDSLMRTEYIDPAMEEHNGYWLPLTEYGSDYYFDCYQAPLGSFRLADSVVTHLFMDGLAPRKLLRAEVSPDGSFSLTYGKNKKVKFEPVDLGRKIYRSEGHFGHEFWIPAEEIGNVELIRQVNTTGDLM
jgi:hypothetical protein